MKKIILRSVIISAIITAAVNLAGFLTNLFTYKTMRKMFLCRQLSGGEWMGWQGFGLMMEKTFPMSSIDDPVTGSTWLSFDPLNLLPTLIGVFLLVFVVSFIISIISARKKRKAAL